MKCSDECLLFLALRRGSRRLCWQSSVFALKGYPRTEPRRSAANFHPIALATTPDLPVTWEALIWGKTFPVIVGNSISTLLLQPQHLSCSARGLAWSCCLSVDQILMIQEDQPLGMSCLLIRIAELLAPVAVTGPASLHLAQGKSKG